MGNWPFSTGYLSMKQRLRKPHPIFVALLAEIEAYRALSGDSITRFGLKVANDSHLIPRLKQGRRLQVDTVDKVRAYITHKTKAVQSK
jgi:hypothetical protein